MAASLIGSACSRGHVDAKEFPSSAVDLVDSSTSRSIVLAGGCFWCTEAVFELIPGVSDVVAGYSGDTKETANYERVCTGATNHAEAIRITYNPQVVSYGQLLKVFFSLAHDPTTLNRQGNDEGRQYRSAIFYANDDEKRVAEAYIRQLNDAKAFGSPIVTTLEKLDAFYEAEKYHQDYARENPNQGYIVQAAAPKVQKTKAYLASTPSTQPSTQPTKRE